MAFIAPPKKCKCKTPFSNCLSVVCLHCLEMEAVPYFSRVPQNRHPTQCTANSCYIQGARRAFSIHRVCAHREMRLFFHTMHDLHGILPDGWTKFYQVFQACAQHVRETPLQISWMFHLSIRRLEPGVRCVVVVGVGVGVVGLHLRGSGINLTTPLDIFRHLGRYS